MQPTTIEALVIIALVLSPGYIFTQVARRVIAHVPEATDLRLLLTIITYGTVIQALAFPLWTNRVLGYYLDGQLRQHQDETFRWAGAVCLLLPVTLGLLVGWLVQAEPIEAVLERIGLGYVARTPSAWDHAMAQPEGSWVKVHLKDGGGVVAGIFGKDSFASLDPNRADVYLQQAWQIDAAGTITVPVVDTDGVWVSHDVIAYIEFFDRKEQRDGPAPNHGRSFERADNPPDPREQRSL